DPSPTSTCPPGPPGPPAGANGSSDITVNFDPDPADLALSSVPGQEAFDPRRHRFSDDELKPQPMIKKARKMLVPDEQKVLHLPQSISALHKNLLTCLFTTVMRFIFKPVT
ncbi:hypothetical protein XENOCAPTIV_005858, partial [Xenoophorus captivus]